MITGTGIPIQWDRTDRVNFEVKSYVSKSKAVLDRAEEKAREGKAKNYGKIFYAVPVSADGGPLPTLEEYLAEQEEKRQREVGNFRIGQHVPFSNTDWTPPED